MLLWSSLRSKPPVVSLSTSPFSDLGDWLSPVCCIQVCVFVCFIAHVCVWLPPTHQIAEEKDNSLTWPSWLSSSYAPACVWANPTASRTTSPRAHKYHAALAYEAHMYPHYHRKHHKGRHTGEYTHSSLHSWQPSSQSCSSLIVGMDSQSLVTISNRSTFTPFCYSPLDKRKEEYVHFQLCDTSKI